MAEDTPLSAEKAALLAGSYKEYGDYFNKFSHDHFPDLRLLVLSAEDPNRNQHVRDAVQATLEDPKRLNRTGAPSYTEAQPAFNRYADELVASIDSNIQRSGMETPDQAATSRTLAFYQTNHPEADIQNNGGQISPIILNHAGCNNCGSSHNLQNNQLDNRFEVANKQLDRLATGYHEFAHAGDEHGSTIPSKMFSDLTSSRDYKNRSESLADSFSTLMMLREFGSLGRDYVRLGSHSDPGDAMHMTQRAVDASVAWAEKNPDKLKSATPAELLELAKQISSTHSLTPTEVRETDDYLEKYRRQETITADKAQERLDAAQRRHDAGQPPLQGYGPMAQEMDRYYTNFVKDLPANVRSMNDQLDTALPTSRRGIEVRPLQQLDAGPSAPSTSPAVASPIKTAKPLAPPASP